MQNDTDKFGAGQGMGSVSTGRRVAAWWRRRACLVSVGLGALVLAACDETVEPPAAAPLSADDEAAIQQAVASSLGNGLATGYSIAVWRDGDVIYQQAFGSADEGGSPATPDMLFQIGSDTKKITALALLQQVDADALDLDDPVGAILPELELATAPGYFAALPVHDLLQHRSGLYDYTPWTDAPDDAYLAATVFGSFAQNEYLVAPPDTGYQYSNPNYSLAGLIVERLGGKPWADVVSDNVFAPLDMQHSYGRRDDALGAGERLASGHGNVLPSSESFALLEGLDSELGWLAPEQQPDNAFIRPAGLVWSTASDQARLLGFLIDGDPAVLSDASRRAMLAPHPSVLPHTDQVGYDDGLFVGSGWQDVDGQYHAVPTVVHGGNTDTMTSGSILLPEQRIAVSVLANGADEVLDPLMASILAIAAQGRMPEPATPPARVPPATDLAAYAGEYTEPNLGDVHIVWQDEQLEISVPVLDALEVPYDAALEPALLDVFTWSAAGVPTRLSFYDGPDGAAHVYAIGDEIALTRVPVNVQP